MGIYLNPGKDDFVLAIQDDIYVDKTGIIAYTNHRIGKRNRYLCVSRPRRFGKSMTAEMLAAYYERGEDTRELFEPYSIAKEDSFETHLNKYLVIALNIAEFYSMIKQVDNMLDMLQKYLRTELLRTYPNIDYMDNTNLVLMLQEVYREKGIPFVFIIDEWDCIFREGQKDWDGQKTYLDFLRNLLKDRAYVGLAYMTGILPIKKYGTHSALNMFEEISMTRPGKLAEYMGFTEEVRKLCEKYHRGFDKMKQWYDGYLLDGRHVYNPKSVVDSVLNNKFESYWVSTETYEALKIYIDMNMDGLKEAVVTMIGGGTCEIDAESFQNDMTTFESKEDVMSLLVHLGYLAYNGETREVFIPNNEIRAEYVRAMRDKKWSKVIDAIKDSNMLLEATLQKNEIEVAKAIDKVHDETTSILTYNNENSLSCAISIAYYSAKKDYEIFREMLSGKGFADLVFLPRKESDKPALVVELKYDKTAKGAVEQIKEKNYPKTIESYVGKILLVGVNYEKQNKSHSCIIEEWEVTI
ncbi:MAG: AAA family ATPase [Clostridiales bacterium]|nr:AAA family ATPase [Clostridiales bacterium]